MSVLSIQSHVAYGHVGNAAACFSLQRLGVNVWPIMTVQFSNHTGYGAWRGEVFTGDMIRELVSGISERGVLGECDAVLSGYMGGPDIGKAILETVDRVRAVNPEALYCCDPVIGDVGRDIYVREGIPELMRDQALMKADIITPNHFELSFLSGRDVRTTVQAVDAARALIAKGPKVVVVTSFLAEEVDADKMAILAVTEDDAWRVETPRLTFEHFFAGTGDVFTALFLAYYLRSRSPSEALSRTASAVYALVKKTHEEGGREIRLIDGQNLLLNPPEIFPPHALS